MVKEASSTSPFAVMTKQEQRHQWNVWHAQQNATRPVEEGREAASVRSLPGAQPAEAEAQPRETRDSPSAQVPYAQRQPAQVTYASKPHHGQYQAVLRRMQQAGSHTASFASAASKPETLVLSAPVQVAAACAVPVQSTAEDGEVNTVQPESGRE